MVLYRAVDATELASIVDLQGRFTPSPSIPDPKGFFFTQRDASRFATTMQRILGDFHFVVRTELPEHLVRNGVPHLEVAGEGPGVYLRPEDLLHLSPAILMEPS